MGCGSSSTQVKEFRPLSRQDSPTIKKAEINSNQAAHTTIREKSDVSNKSKVTKKSFSSSSSSSSTISVKEQAKSGKLSRSSSAKSDSLKKYKRTEQTETKHDNLIGKTGDDGDHNSVAVSKPFEITEDHENDIHVDETGYEFVDKHMLHENDVKYEGEKTTGEKSEKENSYKEYDEFSGFELGPIAVPEINKNKEFPVYTIDDIANNNAEKGKNNWFLYGKKVYTLDLFTPIVFSRVQEYLDMIGGDRYSADEILTGKTEYGSYPVYVARLNGVRRKEMDQVLPASQVGKLGGISREEYLSRLKQSVDNVISDLEAEEKLTEYLVDYLEQLSRWLSSYPNVELEQPVDRTNVDPNQCEFPLPDKIRADSTVIRKWARDWIEFDMTIDEGGAWPLIPLLNEDWGDLHQTYVDICAKREDAELPEMNMEIEGEAAWNVIPLDVVKNDETTDQQEETWKAREKRKDLNDPERMRRRRKQIADSFLKRHDTRLKAEDMVQYVDWAHRLEEHWKEFQELCETFVLRRRVTEEEVKAPDTADLETKKLADNEGHAQETQEPTQLPENIPPQDTMSIRSDHGLH